jgi:hypothetical protein
MAELADALDSKSSSERSVGSTPTLGTKPRTGERISEVPLQDAPRSVYHWKFFNVTPFLKPQWFFV